LSDLRADFPPQDENDDLPRGDDEKIVEEAKERYRRCQSYYSVADQRFADDYRFANGDADNGYQWPDSALRTRGKDKPNLTINKTRQHNLQIVNDGRQNKPSVKVRPTGGSASMKSAEVIEGIIRHIEYISNAQVAYDWARHFQVTAGRGYLRVTTDYAGNDTFNQEIYIRRVIDPLSVYLDFDAREFDFADGKFAFLFKEVERDNFEHQYPQYKDKVAVSTLGDLSWTDEDHIIVAEYYRRSEKKDRLMHFTVPESGEDVVVRESEAKKQFPPEIWKAVLDDPGTKTREIVDKQVEQYLIMGDTIVERGVWPGETIPIVPVKGEETIIDGIYDCKGHTRACIDPQRMANYWFSAATEHVALQSKTPYIAGKRAIEGVETYWETANTTNHSYLPYNDIDDEGNPLPPPQRQEPPTFAPAYVSGMQIASQELMAVTGQYAPQLGEPSNERSGKAIAERQRQGDNATYHFIDNEAVAIRRIGKIILEIYAKVYDERTVIKILAEDGEQSEIQINRAQPEAVKEEKTGPSEVRRVFNPDVGKYEVHADIGPAYSTQRQEAWNAFVQIASMAPDLMHVAGDLFFQAADFPMADKLAERLKRTIPPGILGEGLPPAVEQQMQQLQMQAQKATQIAQKATMQLADAKKSSMVGQLKLAAKGVADASETRKLDIAAYEAETKRLEAFLDAMVGEKQGTDSGAGGEEDEIKGLDPKQIARLAAQLVLDAMHTPLTGAGGAVNGGMMNGQG
jgi:hypothetical protein